MKKLMSLMLAMTICFSATALVKASAQDVDSSKYVLETLASCESSVLTTDELSLSRASDSDLGKLAIYYKDAETGYFLRNNDKELSEQEALANLKKYNSGENVSFVIKDSKGDIAGEIILTLLVNSVVNVAYWIVPKFRGHGYAAKACELLIRELHRKYPDLIFFIGLDGENQISKRVVEKLEAALTSANEIENLDNLEKAHYEFIKQEPFKLKYKISPLDENDDSKFKFDVFVNDEQFGSAVYTKEQIENVTYKKILELKEIEVTRWHYFIRLVH